MRRYRLEPFLKIIMKILERNKAIELRKRGGTFNEILREIPVSKGSLSYWLRDIKLTRKQLARIEYKNELIKDNFIRFNELRKKQSEDNKRIVVNYAIKEIECISERELKLIGIALYWAEGYNKDSSWETVSFTNSNPEMIKLIMAWFRLICKVSDGKFRIRIQGHALEKIKESEKYWSQITNIPLVQFTKPYIRISPTSKKKMGNVIPYKRMGKRNNGAIV